MLTFKTAAKKIRDRYNYLSLIKFDGTVRIATFLDIDYGEFEAQYKAVYSGKTNNPERGKQKRIDNAKANVSKRQEGMIKKWGVDNPSKLKKFRDKAKETLHNNYGVDVPAKSDIIKQQISHTNLEKYGTETTFLNARVQDKCKQTNLDKYGVENIFQSEIIKKKIKATNLSKYGFEYANQSRIVRDKIKKTNLERYGVEVPLQNKDVFAKLMKTNSDKLGVPHAGQSEIVKRKIRETNLSNGKYHNIDGYSAQEFYNLYSTDALHKESCIDMSVSLEQMAERLKIKQPHLMLIEYNGSNNSAIFIDEEFGEFSATYSDVARGKSSHAKRGKYNRIVKSIETNLQRYGVTNPASLPEVIDKRKATCVDRYGVDNPGKVKVIRDKAEQTNLDRYGVKNVSQSKEIRNKVEQTNLQNLGHKYPMQSDKCKEIRDQTNIKKYGFKSPMQSEEVKEKAKQTNIDKGNVIVIDGKSASEYYKENQISCAYSTFIQNINKFGVTEAVNLGPKKTNIECVISTFLTSHGISFVFNKSLSGSKLKPDFNVNDHKVLIECDGLYWHSDKFKKKNYHIDKSREYLKLGYQSLFFREEEFINKLPIVESIILAKLGQISKRVFARKCKFEMIDTKSSAQFFHDNHLMGKGTGKTYALLYEGEIVSAMRVVNKKEHIEISRFCNRLNTYVLGGFSKLMKQALLATGKKKVVSFVDMRYGDGHSLQNLGFEGKSNHVSFKWTNFKETFHRMTFKGNTGYECGMSKVWDCGQKKFELIVKGK